MAPHTDARAVVEGDIDGLAAARERRNSFSRSPALIAVSGCACRSLAGLPHAIRRGLMPCARLRRDRAWSSRRDCPYAHEVNWCPNRLGTPVLRKEDPALLSGRGRYADDLPVPPGTLHAHVIRSPHAHAKIVGIDAAAALAQDGVWAVITGEDVRKLSDPFLIALKAPVNQWSLAVERVRYVGEPVALVVAESRYLAEDAAELVSIDYEPLEAVIDPQAARDDVGAAAACRSRRPTRFRSGNSPTAIRRARSRRPMPASRSPCDYPRSSFTPMECYVGRRRVPADRRQLRRAGEFPGAVQHASGDGARAARARPEAALAHPARLAAAASASSSRCFPTSCSPRSPRRITGRPVKWVEDRARASRSRRAPAPTASPRSRPPSPRMAASWRCGSTSSRTTAPFCARRCRGRSTACTARSPAPTTSPMSR